MGLKFYQLFVFLIALLTFSPCSHAQSYGLGFHGHETMQDKRTGLDLSNGKAFCFNADFELSFDLSFIPDHTEYFGYILRIIENDTRNIDLIYAKDALDQKHFKVVVGEAFSRISFNIPDIKNTDHWNKIRLSFNFDKGILQVYSGKEQYAQTIKMKRNSCFKILFGANEDLNFKTTDVPPMKIRTIRIQENGSLKYAWPLNEESGAIASEEVARHEARVTNPLWIKRMHTKWQLQKSWTMNGPGSVAFDHNTETLFIMGADSMFRYMLPLNRTRSLSYRSGKQFRLRGNQSLFDPKTGKILHLSIDQKIVAALDTSQLVWDKRFKQPDLLTDYWQFNKFYSESDSSLYTFDGYGHFTYRNEINRYHIPTGTWSKMPLKGSVLIPRYLGALGATKNGAYLMGGYGSSTGKQELNPKNLYDLQYFDLKTKTLKEIYRLPAQAEDFVFANSLVVDEAARSYFGLIFAKHKFDSSLQLMEGSLKRPDFKLVGDRIPYQFHDIRSFADLFYCPASKTFVAVTLFHDENNRTKVNIYTLYGPPLPLSSAAEKVKTEHLGWKIGGLLLVLFAGTGLFFIYRKKQRSGQLLTGVFKEPLAPEADEHHHTQVYIVSKGRVNLQEEKEEIRNSIFLFGGFQIFDRQGADITRLFTPVLKELFLVILLHTIRYERGISSEKLKELLWFDKSVESARNNRSVNMLKLKNILDKMDHCQVSKETGSWKIHTDYASVYVDYHTYQMIIKDKSMLNKKRIMDLTAIIQRGSFLSNDEHQWLDAFKSEVSNEVIDTYLHFSGSIQIAEDPEFLIKLANYIALFDAVNEEAMEIKCKALAFLGKHSLAKSTFEHFCKDYKVIYDEEFDKGFHEILD